MAQHEVQSSGQIAVFADRVWSLVRDFCGQWHPAIATMDAEYDEAGRLIRAFTVHGDEATYRERLAWFSDSERSMAYTHLEGIAGVDAYDARLVVTVDGDDKCIVTMSAVLTAAEPRGAGIADGTKAIFDDAIETIRKLALGWSETQTAPHGNRKEQRLKSHIINSSPSLAVSYVNSLKTEGEATSDTLCLFLHGIGGNRKNWNNQLVAVAPYCQAVSLDLRGYGDSELGDNQTTIDDYCADILRVADAFNAKKLILCGLSYGAWIATSFAMRHPERLAGLVLSGGCTGMSEAGVKEREAFRSSREVPLNAGKTPADFAPNVVPVLAGPAITDTVRNELLTSMQAIPSATYADALRCFTNPPETFDFAKLTMPVLLMTGDSDKLAPPQQIKQVAQRILEASPSPDVRYECLADAGHVCNLEAPWAYNIPLVELVQRLAQ